jgi:hypothetical protein
LLVCWSGRILRRPASDGFRRQLGGNRSVARFPGRWARLSGMCGRTRDWEDRCGCGRFRSDGCVSPGIITRRARVIWLGPRRSLLTRSTWKSRIPRASSGHLGHSGRIRRNTVETRGSHCVQFGWQVSLSALDSLVWLAVLWMGDLDDRR